MGGEGPSEGLREALNDRDSQKVAIAERVIACVQLGEHKPLVKLGSSRIATVVKPDPYR